MDMCKPYRETSNERLKIESTTADEELLYIVPSQVRKQLAAALPPPLELTSQRQYSLKPDMADGWRPANVAGAPIPMYFNYEQPLLP